MHSFFQSLFYMKINLNYGSKRHRFSRILTFYHCSRGRIKDNNNDEIKIFLITNVNLIFYSQTFELRDKKNIQVSDYRKSKITS